MIIPVSYTHLDVYKRQHKYRREHPCYCCCCIVAVVLLPTVCVWYTTTATISFSSFRPTTRPRNFFILLTLISNKVFCFFLFICLFQYCYENYVTLSNSRERHSSRFGARVNVRHSRSLQTRPGFPTSHVPSGGRLKGGGTTRKMIC